MKSFLPWLCVVGLLGGVVFLFSANQKLTREASALRDETNQTGSPVQAQQIAQLQKDNQELLKLRNEVRQLRDEKKQLSQQAQTAQAQAQAAQANVLTLSTNLQAVEEARRQKMMAERYGLAPGAQQPQPIIACVNHLRQLDGAKQQWALENRKTANDTPAEKDIAVYLKGGMPRCPAGGTYVLNAAGAAPACSIPGHALPQAQ